MNNSFASTIEKWYANHCRELPWRDTRDPYLIWVSEIILQQTRVAQGLDYYLRFTERFPSVESLASASEDEVLLLWQGLGYYSRARHLREAAQQVVELGHFPKNYVELRRLSGVGDYTAAAIASFAYGEPRAVLDGNVFRVLSRYLGVDEAIDSTKGRKTFRALADAMLDPHHPALYNQAIMDFGAMVCSPQPQCVVCPLLNSCQAFRDHRQAELPVKAKAKVPKERHLIYIYAREGGKMLLRRRSSNDIWKGLYELPVIEYDSTKEHPSVPDGAHLVAEGITHRLTHRLLIADAYLLDVSTQSHRKWVEEMQGEGYQWVAESDRDQFAVPRLIEDIYSKCALFF
ncbi:MAG: A/G-specific adenine glycosylase [Bacteroidales bacterium]|nr:A/G-specific adenine glycosylase [Candidatus Physcousia equi]